MKWLLVLVIIISNHTVVEKIEFETEALCESSRTIITADLKPAVARLSSTCIRVRE